MTRGGVPERRWRGAHWAWFLLAGATACAPIRSLMSGQPAGLSPEDGLRAGAVALESDDFNEAALRLAPLIDGCLDEPLARRAALLRASMELDPANPDGSADAAAKLAARVLRSSPPDEIAHAQARALYRMAVDAGGSRDVPPETQGCSGNELTTLRMPGITGPTTDERLRALSDTLRAQADTLAALSHALAAQTDSLEHALSRAHEAERHARALEEELNRIRQLLRGGTEPRS